MDEGNDKTTDAAEDTPVGRHTASDAKIPAASEVLDEQVEEVLGDIESNSSFALRHKTEAEEIDPSDLAASDLEAGGEDAIVDSELQPVNIVDELADEIDVSHNALVEDVVPKAEETLESEEVVERRRGRLRNFLGIAVVALILIAAVIGVLLWQQMLSPNVKPSDTDELNTGSAGAASATFQPVSSDAIPPLATLFGSTLADVQAACGSVLVVGETTDMSDTRVTSMKSLADAQLVDTTGVKIADVGLGLDEGGRLVYAYCTFDLDALAVADADFDELAASNVVSRSLLSKLGVSDEALDSAALDTQANPAAVTSGSSQVTQQAVFTGTTALASPATFQVTETYDMSAGQTLGDNSVIRTALVELF